jgi:hypothetical protein
VTGVQPAQVTCSRCWISDPSALRPARVWKAASSGAEQRAWDSVKPERPDPEVYRRDVSPRVGQMSLKASAKATGLSVSYCARVRRGALTPHPRWWEALGRGVARWGNPDRHESEQGRSRHWPSDGLGDRIGTPRWWNPSPDKFCHPAVGGLRIAAAHAFSVFSTTCRAPAHRVGAAGRAVVLVEVSRRAAVGEGGHDRSRARAARNRRVTRSAATRTARAAPLGVSSLEGR